MSERANRVNELRLPRELGATSIFDADDRLRQCAVTGTDRHACFF